MNGSIRIRNFLVSLSFFSISLYAGDHSNEISWVPAFKKTKPVVDEKSPCDFGSKTFQVGARHLEGSGVGYSHGYTTIEGFLSTDRCYKSWTSFVDLRGHIFNNSRLAANAGLGVRYISSLAWGLNGYYDFRNTHHANYNQVGVGLEVIGPFWRVDCNGYLPVGKKKSSFFDRRVTGTGPLFDFGFFQGNQMFIALSGDQTLSAKREFDFKGIDANFSISALKRGKFSLEASAGPYYFHGSYGKFAAGGKGKVNARFAEYLSFSVSGSYDNLFHARFQGELGLSIPLGPKTFGKKCKKSRCEIPYYFDAQLARGANRNEIIVVDHHEKVLSHIDFSGTSVAINPATGLPYFIVFVNNLSSSLGTYESPFPTIQEAMALVPPAEIIYVYPGDGSPYDADVILQNDQFFFGSGVAQTVLTTVGPITIPPQSVGLPTIENTLGSTIITLDNRNTVSGFNLLVLSAGNTVVGTAKESLSFINNVFETTVTVGMNNLFLTDCSGTLLVQNNQFTMDPADTGSFGILLTDAGTEASTLSVLSNTFTNHAARAISLSYSGNSSPTLNIANGNVFTPPTGAAGTDAIDISTSGAATLAGSISNQNSFTGYTSNIINLAWSGTGSHALTISENSLSSDPTVPGTRGIELSNATSGGASLTISGNQITDQYGEGINCDVSENLSLAIEGNVIIGASIAGATGIRINPNGTAAITGSITGNSCSNHLGANIAAFPTDSSSVSLSIARNTLTGPDIVPGGSFPNGIQLSGNASSSMNLTINDNQITNHTDLGINLFVSDTATILATIDGNTVIAPDTVPFTGGIRVSASNSSPVTSICSVTNNTCSGHTNANIQCYPNNFSIIDLTVTGNILSGPTVTPGGSNPIGIQISTSNSVQMNALIEQNQCLGHSFQGISTFSSDSSELTMVVHNNVVTAALSGTATNGIVANSSTSGQIDFTVTNNTCSGHTNGCIQSFPSGSGTVTLNISNNVLTAATDGVSGANPNGIQVGTSGTAQLLSGTFSGNTWTGPGTYQSMTGSQGIGIGIGDSSTAANVTVSNNTLVLPFTSYPANTGSGGIQVNTFNAASLQGVVVTNNSVTFPLSTYQDFTSLQGIQVQSSNTSSLTMGTISDNTITYAPLTTAVTNFSTNGINVSSNDDSIFGTVLSPILVQQNTVIRSEGNGLNCFGGSTMDTYITLSDNSIAMGGVTQSFGVFVAGASGGKIKALVSDNTIDGNNGGFFGILALNLSPTCQDITLQNNSITNVHGNNPSVPGPPPGGGIGIVPLSSGDLNVTILNNGLSGNTPQGLFAIDSAAVGGSGNLCLTIQNNHGVGVLAPNGYTLSNPSSAPPATFVYDDAGGNTGTFNFFPSSADFTPGTCSSCP